jgi:hypothetical protein
MRLRGKRMPVHSLTFTLTAYRHDAPPITDDEFLTPLAIAPGEVEAAWSWKERWGEAGVRILTASSARPVEDAAFDDWVAAPCAAVVRFLDGRPAGAYDRLRAAGLVNIHVAAEVVYVGEFPIVDWPEALYAACRQHGIGLLSNWELPEEQGLSEPPGVTNRCGTDDS